MPRLTILVALALAGTIASTEAAKPSAKPMAPKPTIAKTQPPKGGAMKPITVHGSSAKASAKGPSLKAASAKPTTGKTTGVQAKPTSAKTVKPAKADAKAAKVDAKATKLPAKTSTNTSPTSNTRVSTNAIDFTATTVGRKLEKNGALRSKIETKLQAGGYAGSVYEAAYGFKNLGQFNAATNQAQNHGYSFELLKVLMTGTYVDPNTHAIYRANRLPDGTVTLVSADNATNPASTLSLGQSKQAIAGGAEMPDVVAVEAKRRF
jgi:hypothetical protein